jgi:large subunit ribosomal protein L4
MEIPILTSQGKKTGRKATLPPHIFGVTPNMHVVYLEVKHMMANKRQGTHKTKEKGAITASTRKVQKQKGSGNARRGSLKSGILRGGGNTFGPQPRTYSSKVNKKQKQIARQSVLSHKAAQNDILVLEDFTFEAPKTKEYLAFLQALSLSDSKTLLVLPKVDTNIIRSARNLGKAQVVTMQQLNTYQALHAQKLLFLESTLAPLQGDQQKQQDPKEQKAAKDEQKEKQSKKAEEPKSKAKPS